jgi:hypothetical protein
MGVTNFLGNIGGTGGGVGTGPWEIAAVRLVRNTDPNDVSPFLLSLYDREYEYMCLITFGTAPQPALTNPQLVGFIEGSFDASSGAPGIFEFTPDGGTTTFKGFNPSWVDAFGNTPISPGAELTINTQFNSNIVFRGDRFTSTFGDSGGSRDFYFVLGRRKMGV